ncbi:MAG: FAD-dependent oxidoreductase [Firmicutes bacterium]|nr:FAD-dependent oxidoreductase [Bacillota bacterium]MBR4023955.1 FAD-dependent oxidoreductase [Bacillota bacterium]
MNRLSIRSQDEAQKTIAGLYKDLERRIIASPPGQCPVDLAVSFLRLCHSQSCGKCVPCRVGIRQLQDMMENILNLDTQCDMYDLEILERTAKAIAISADCAIGSEAANMVLRGLQGYREDYEYHIKYNTCSPKIRESAQPVPCVRTCPANVDIPGYIALVKHQRYADAVSLIRKDNPFPTVCALICEHPCEMRCRRSLVDAPINIRGMKRYAVDNCGENVPVPPKMDDTGKRIAIIGGGPSGLTAAYYLAIMGHKPTIFEKRAQLGGMLRYGIPSYRLPRERLQWDIDAILSTGVEVKLNYDISTKEAMQDLRDNYDATYISIGSHNAKNLGIPGEFAKGVIPAVEMLRGIGDDAMPDFKNKSVAVIGGGNVAMDVARTAKRLGASEVTIVYRRRRVDMTALPDEVAGAVAEGCELVQLKAPARIDTDTHGNVTALWAKPQIVGMADESGRPRPLDANGPEEKIPCQIIISAIGQATDIRFFEEFGIPVFRGNIKAGNSSVVDEVPGTYAGGDCVTGPSTVINAVAAGKVAAANIDTYLGYHHEMSVDIDIPLPDHQDDIPYGRVELKERFARVRGNDFDAVEEPMSFEEAMQECSRCLRCDYHGYGAFRGGREERW